MKLRFIVGYSVSGDTCVISVNYILYYSKKKRLHLFNSFKRSKEGQWKGDRGSLLPGTVRNPILHCIYSIQLQVYTFRVPGFLPE